MKKIFAVVVSVVLFATWFSANVLPVKVSSVIGETLLDENDGSNCGNFALGWPFAFQHWSVHQISKTEFRTESSTYSMAGIVINVVWILVAIIAIVRLPWPNPNYCFISLAVSIVIVLSIVLSLETASFDLKNPFFARLYQSYWVAYSTVYLLHSFAAWVILTRLCNWIGASFIIKQEKENCNNSFNTN